VKDWVAMLYFQLKGHELKNRFRWLRWWIWRRHDRIKLHWVDVDV